MADLYEVESQILTGDIETSIEYWLKECLITAAQDKASGEKTTSAETQTS
jgi:hypothetical protein